MKFQKLTESTEKTKIQQEYDAYLAAHIENVKKAYAWLVKNLPDVLSLDNYHEETEYYGELEEVIKQHDKSKYINIPDAENYYELTCEYDAYARYFYEDSKDPENIREFNLAWLAHIHANPHHWQHWVLREDSGKTIGLDMPYVFIIEMICDHWSFSWKSNNLYEIFGWYDKNKDSMILSDATRRKYESILSKIKDKLDEEKLTDGKKES